MPNGTLKLYNKLTNDLLVSLDILGTFNIEDNLNETPSNMKVKVITSNTYREEFQVNTVAYHEDTNSWWVIKSDESSYMTTGEYEHEIQLVEYLEFYAYRHLPNCAFAPNTYNLENMLNRLFDIAKLSITVNYPDFLDKDKIMPFFSFENFTVANAIKNISRSINAIPKMVAGFPYQLFTGTITFSNFEPISPSNGDYWFRSVGGNTLFERISGAWVSVTFTSGTITPIIGALSSLRFVNTLTSQLFISSNTWTPTLTFINRNGIDTTIKNVLDDQFPIAYEKNMNSNDQFTTRSVSNITNAKSSVLVVAPRQGGFKNIVENAIIYDNTNADTSRVYLPSKIDRVEFVRLYPKVTVSRFIVGTSTSAKLYEGYYLDKEEVKDAIIANFDEFSKFTLAELEALTMPEPDVIHQINLNDVLGTTYTGTFFRGLHTLKSKFDFDTSDKLTGNYDTIEKVKDKTIHWLPFSNELVLGKTIRDGLTIPFSGASHYRQVIIAQKSSGGSTEQIRIDVDLKTVGFFDTRVPIDELLVQVGYYPIADIKVSIDNDNDAQDEKFFNQSGKVIDSVSISKLITSHTNDSVEGTKIRNAKHFALNDILPLGQLVRDNNQLYVVSQRSIDGHVKNGNEYYNVIYTLSRNRIARSENIVADSAVISYKTPDDNLVNRSQLYKDYIELSLVNNNQEAPYLPMSKALVLSSTLAGTNFDFTVVAKNEFGTTPTTVRYVKNPTAFDLHKAKLMNVNWQSNNLLGYRLDSTGSTYVQTPIVYTDNLGKANNFELLFLDSANLVEAKNSFNFYFSAKASNLIPFEDLTQVDVDFYDSSVLFFNNFSIRIKEDTLGGKPYQKDPFEIPVFEYMIQGNDDYSPNGNIVIGNDLFSTFTGSIQYHYVINNGTRFTAENADKLYVTPTSSERRVIFNRDSGTPHILDLDLYSSYIIFFINTRNTSLITNIGIYATDGTTVKFLFAINDYVENATTTPANDKSNIRVFINNWKI